MVLGDVAVDVDKQLKVNSILKQSISKCFLAIVKSLLQKKIFNSQCTGERLQITAKGL